MQIRIMKKIKGGNFYEFVKCPRKVYLNFFGNHDERLPRSEFMQKYFDNIENQIKNAYDIAADARKKGFDPEDDVAIPLAQNMAERVGGLISVVEPNIAVSAAVTLQES